MCASLIRLTWLRMFCHRKYGFHFHDIQGAIFLKTDSHLFIYIFVYIFFFAEIKTLNSHCLFWFTLNFYSVCGLLRSEAFGKKSSHLRCVLKVVRLCCSPEQFALQHVGNIVAAFSCTF